MNTEGQIGPGGVWAEAARHADAQAEELGVVETIRRAGIDIEALQHVADQRALRCVLMQTNRLDEVRSYDVIAVPMSPVEKAMHGVLMAAYFDGLYIGWHARGVIEARSGNDGRE